MVVAGAGVHEHTHNVLAPYSSGVPLAHLSTGVGWGEGSESQIVNVFVGARVVKSVQHSSS